ncbi:G-protein coupled receptor 161-like [Ruditapes philippinarum]|uniref:G-protein coupled receptor 161-like n=1 Tax=Ruditapes philippinarum TaxID=129788 RepID=UPI00295ACB4E|nr:G-protein coupled receptor 161-like [Ruditapes philippinarum]
MIRYPAEYIALVCFLLVGEVIVGLTLNLYIMIRWYSDTARKAKNRKNGNNFIVTLKFMDLFICGTAIPFAFAVLIVDSDHNLVVCFIKEGLVMFASSGSSFCVLLISVDRYIAIVWPTKNLLTAGRILFCRVFAVLFALIGLILPSLSLLMGLYTNAYSQSKNILPCRHVVWIFKPNYLYEVYYIISFLIAVITTFICYHYVLKVVRRRMLLRSTTVSSTSAAAQKDKSYAERFRRQEYKATRVAFAVVVSFLVCWGPHVIITVIQLTLVENIIVDMIQSVCLVFAFLAPIIHPVIYTYETNDRRKTFSMTNIPICGAWFKGGSRVTPEQTNVESMKISSRVLPNTSRIDSVICTRSSPVQRVKKGQVKISSQSNTESGSSGHLNVICDKTNYDISCETTSITVRKTADEVSEHDV